ncbi:MAG: hypothetical protein GX099_07615 [Clostridiaceae bacterium]|nr:hypothetical protein [Oscillospiraceae bacterium]NLO63276.1 hypothetical protein [Clostridiaceae bacterium]
MKCPKCKTENGSRSVCLKCGLFLYKPEYRNGPKLSEKELRQRDRETVWRVFKKVFRFISVVVSAFVIAFLIYVLLKTLFGI